MRNNTPGKDTIYYNALPYYQDRMDLFEMKEMFSIDFDAWFLNLWNGKGTDALINVDTLHLEKIRKLYFQVRNFEKTHGPRSLAIGFPIIVDTNESDLVFAPVFLQQVWLEPVFGNPNQWKIGVNPAWPVQPNFRLFRHLKSKYGFDLVEESKELANDFSFAALESFCHQLGAKLHFESTNFESLQVCPGIDEIGLQSEQGALKWSAVLALFPPQDIYTPSGTVMPEDRFKPTAGISPTFLPIPLNREDVETANALEVISRNQVVVVKERQNGACRKLVANLLLNQLAEGKRCLVVSPFASSLSKTSQALSQEGLIQLHYVLDDAVHDALPFLELVRTAGNSPGRDLEFDEKNFDVKRKNYKRARTELNQHYQAVRKQVFGKYTWSEVVGLWMREKGANGQDLLGGHLNPKDFDFSYEAYEEQGESVARCQELFRSVNTLNHPLTALNAQVFTEMDVEKAFNYVAGKLEEKLRDGAELQKDIIGVITGYTQTLRKKLEGSYRQLLKEANHLLKTHDSFADRYGDLYLKSKKRPGSLSLMVSNKRKEVAEAMDVTAKLFRLFVRHFGEQRLIEFDFSACNGGYHVECVQKEINAFIEAIKKWHSTLDELVKDNALRLNHKTADPALGMTDGIKEIEDNLERFIARLNEDELFQNPFENKTLTLPQRQKYLEYIVDSLETIKLNLRDFHRFYQWQRTWLQLPENSKKLIGAIVKVKPVEWGSAFRLWFLNQVLLRNASEYQPNGELPLNEVAEAWSILKQLLKDGILKRWHKAQQEEKRNLKRSNGAYHKLLFGRKVAKEKKVPDLKSFFSNAFDCLTSYFPVLLVTPHVAKNVLAGSSRKFDLIIYTDSDRFSIEDAAIISNLGGQMVIAGREEDLGTESSLINYAIDNEVPVLEINGQLKKVSQSIFSEGNVLKTPNVTANYVGGRFDELEGTNLVEAQHVVRLLNQAKPNEKRVFPSIGVIAFTHEQRDLIQNQLLRLKQENSIGSEKILQLERNGMGVFSLDEIYGQSFDELIVSCTLGPVDGAGTLTRKLAFLNTVENLQALRCLIAQQSSQVTLVHSLPENLLLGARVSDSEQGIYLLANLLSLADAQASENLEFTRECQKKLGFVLPENTHQSVFLKEVKRRLHSYMDADEIAFASMPPGLHKPLFVKPRFVIQQDAFFSRLENTFGPWELSMQQEIRKMGLEFRAEWASKWFQEPKLHERYLASFILKNLNEEKETSDKLD